MWIESEKKTKYLIIFCIILSLIYLNIIILLLLFYDDGDVNNSNNKFGKFELHDSTKKINNEQNSLFESLNQKYCGQTQCKFLFLYSNINNYSNRDSLTNPNRNANLLKFFINLAKSLEYTIVLPNVGFSDGNDDDNNNLGGQLRIDACQKYPFGFYYDVDNLESKFLEAQFISQSNFSNWLIERNEIIHNNFNGNDDKKRKDLELKVEHLNLNLRLNQETEELLISFEEPLVEYVQNEIMIQGCLEQFNNNNNNSERGGGAFNLTRLYLLDKMVFKEVRINYINFESSKEMMKYLKKDLVNSFNGKSDIIMINQHDLGIYYNIMYPGEINLIKHSELILQEANENIKKLNNYMTITLNLKNNNDYDHDYSELEIDNCLDKLIVKIQELKSQSKIDNVYYQFTNKDNNYENYLFLMNEFEKSDLKLKNARINSSLIMEKRNSENYNTGIHYILDRLISKNSTYFVGDKNTCSKHFSIIRNGINDAIFIEI
nr:4055_t:CDS:1 [Entrophospora candida]